LYIPIKIFGQEPGQKKKSVYKVKFYVGDYIDREEKANQDGAVCYVEQHFNSTENRNTNYTIVLIATGSSVFTRSWAQDYVDKVSEKFQIPKGYDNGIKIVKDGDRGYGNIRHAKMPAILLEPFFICNSTGVEWAKTRQDELAQILVETIYKFFPRGGLVAFSVGHKYKISNPDDKGACPFEDIREIDFNEGVLLKAAERLDTDYTVSSIEESPHYFSLFNEICNLVEKNFYEPEYLDKTFDFIKETYKTNAGEIRSEREFSKVINNMLKQLKVSHTDYYTKDDSEYYQLASMFSDAEEIKKLFHNKEILYPGTGILAKEIDGKVFVVSLLSGSVAEKAGLLKGDEIISVNGKPWRGVKSFIDKEETTLLIKRKEGQNLFEIKIRTSLINPSEEFLQAERESVKIYEKEDKKIGYIHIWSFAGKEYYKELLSAVSGRLKEADALLVDLRDGWGGAQLEYLNVFNEKIPAITMIDRDGKITDCHQQWRKPVVILINNRVRSGKEILAYGFKKHKIGTLIGEKTAGATLAGKIFVVSDGSLLYLASFGTRIDGENLEGKGVEPDISVPMEIKYCEGKDIQLEHAIEFLIK